MSVFGNNNQGNPSGSSAFGNVAGMSNTNTTAPAGTTSVFGTAGSIFGNTPSSTTSIFGKQSASPAVGATPSTAAIATPSLFGGTSTTPVTTSATAIPNFFGGSAPAPAAAGVNTTPSLFSSSSPVPVTTGTSNTGSSFFATPPASASPHTASLFGAAGSTNANVPKPGLFAPLTSTTTAITTPGTTPSAFGSGLFGSKPAESSANATAASKPPSNFFAIPPTTAAASATPGSLFGTVPESAAGTHTTASASGSNGGSSFGSSLLAKKPDIVPGASMPTSTASAAVSTFSLGGSITTPGVAKDATATPTTTSTSTSSPFGVPPQKSDAAPAATSTTGLFGSKDTTSEMKGATPAVSGGGLFGIKPATTSAGTSATLASSALAPKEGDKSKDASLTATIAVPPPSVLRGKTIEEIVNKWSSDLETHVREFNRFAGEVAVWDRALMENGNNLAAIYSHVLAVEREQSDIEQSLDHIEQHQKDLSSTLDAYERSADEILGGQGGSLRALDTGPADTERDKNYMLAAELHAHLDDLSASLSQMIDSVNGLSLAPAAQGLSSPHGNDDSIVQISQILSSHLESLQWIDGAVREIDGKVAEVERRVRDAGANGALGSTTTKQKGFGLSQ